MTGIVLAFQEANSVAVAITLAGIALVAIVAKIAFVIKDKMEVF